MVYELVPRNALVCCYDHVSSALHSADEFIRVQEQLPQVPHYTADDGTVYSLPSREALPTATQLEREEVFDGSCYASTYQTNGHCHTYQEVSGTPTHHTGGVGSRDLSPTILSRFDSRSSTQSDAIFSRSLRLSSQSSHVSVSMGNRRPSMPSHIRAGSQMSVESGPRISRTRLASASYSSPQFPYNDLFSGDEEPPTRPSGRSRTFPHSHPEESPHPPSVVSMFVCLFVCLCRY